MDSARIISGSWIQPESSVVREFSQKHQWFTDSAKITSGSWIEPEPSVIHDSSRTISDSQIFRASHCFTKPPELWEEPRSDQNHQWFFYLSKNHLWLFDSARTISGSLIIQNHLWFFDSSRTICVLIQPEPFVVLWFSQNHFWFLDSARTIFGSFIQPEPFVVLTSRLNLAYYLVWAARIDKEICI